MCPVSIRKNVTLSLVAVTLFSSDISSGDTDDSEVDLYDIRESEGDISGNELVAAYNGPEVQEVGYVRTEALNEEALDVVAVYDGNKVQKVMGMDHDNGQEVQEVGEEGIECPSEDVPDVVDAKHVQEVQEVSDAIIEGLNVEELAVVDPNDEQEVGDAIIEGLNVEEPAVVDPNDEQEVGEEGIECPSEDIPDVVDAKHVQEAQEVGDAIIEGLNVEELAVVDPNDE